MKTKKVKTASCFEDKTRTRQTIYEKKLAESTDQIKDHTKKLTTGTMSLTISTRPRRLPGILPGLTRPTLCRFRFTAICALLTFLTNASRRQLEIARQGHRVSHAYCRIHPFQPFLGSINGVLTQLLSNGIDGIYGFRHQRAH